MCFVFSLNTPGVYNCIKVTAIVDILTSEFSQWLILSLFLDPDNLPPSVGEWLISLHLSDKIETFMNKNFDTMERVMKLWEVELTSVLDITAVGHRKRILASLENRKKPERSLASLVQHSSQHLEREITLKFSKFLGRGGYRGKER